MAAANKQYQEKIENTDFEKPPEEETFRENESTAQAIQQQLKYEAERARVAKAAASGDYTITDAPKYKTTRVEAEPVVVSSSKGSESSWGRSNGYGGFYGSSYGSNNTTVVQNSEDEIKKKRAKEKADKIFKDIFSEEEYSQQPKNIFDIANEEDDVKAQETMKVTNPKQYQKYMKKQKFKASLAKGALNILKMMVENIEQQ